MGLFDSWQKGVAAGKEERRDRIMGEFGQKALGGDRDALAQVYGVDTNAGMQLQQYASQQQAAQRQQRTADLGEGIKLAKGYLQTRDPGLARALLPHLKQLHPELPDNALDLPGADEGLMKAAQALASLDTQTQEQFTLAPGSARYDASGRQIAAQPFQNKPEYVLSPDGTQWLPKPTGPQQPIGGPAGSLMDNALYGAVKQVESGGNPLAVSPAGAVGPMQTMPDTLRDPGFGVAPARNGSVDEQRRVGQQYIDAMVQKYGPVGGLAAYNWGPGNWEAALQRSGGDPQRALQLAPKETQDYVPKVLALTQRGQPGGAIPIPGAIPRNGGQQGDKAANWQVIQGNDGQFYRLNKLTGQLEATSVHGNNAARIQKMEQERLEKVQGVQGALAQTDGALQSIETLLKSPGLERAVGVGSMFPTLPGSDAATFEAQLDTLKAQTFIPMVAQLKGMGALSDAEGKKLADAVGALSLKMGDAAFKVSLNEIKKTLNDAKARGFRKITEINQTASQQYRGASPSNSGSNDASRQALLDKY